MPDTTSIPSNMTPHTDPSEFYMHVRDIAITFPWAGGLTAALADHPDDRVVRNRRGNKVIGVRALQDISFSLRQGDRIAIVGRNGSGKTTLLQALSGILAPDAGEIRYRGRITNLININLGIQAEATGHRNITLRGLAAGYSRPEIEARRAAIADFCELGEFLDMPMETYSSGMKMRLIFAIATSFNPEILILDEWLSAGDVVFKRKATERMQSFVEKAGILILASHSRQLLLDNCEQAIWLDGGRIRDMGPVKNILDAYEAASK